jgi:hypothetical protein
MKAPLYFSSLIFTTLFAQDATQLNQPNMEMIMQKMQAIQVCMSKIDLSQLSSLENETLRVKTEVQEMCAQGKRDQADKEAKLFYEKVMKLPAIIQMKACTQGLVPEFDLEQRVHVCDAQEMDFGIPDTNRINW